MFTKPDSEPEIAPNVVTFAPRNESVLDKALRLVEALQQLKTEELELTFCRLVEQELAKSHLKESP